MYYKAGYLAKFTLIARKSFTFEKGYRYKADFFMNKKKFTVGTGTNYQYRYLLSIFY